MKHLNFKNKITFALVLAGLLTSSTAYAHNKIDFSGYLWTIRNEPGLPGDSVILNNWGDTSNDVFVDDAGALHLKVSQHADDPTTTWYSSEVYLPTSLGYGKYTFDINTDVSQIDHNLVASPFIYQDGTHEFDIEHSFWNNEEGDQNLFFTAQPHNKKGNQQTSASNFSSGVFQDIINWQPDKVVFSTAQNGNEMSSWTYASSTDGSSDNFVPGEERLHINFWQYKSLEPITDTSSEFVVNSFSFDPYVAPVSTSTDPGTTTPSTTVSINLSVQTSQESFEFPNLVVTACPEVDGSTTSTLNAMCALKQSGLTTDWSTWGSDMFLNSINSYVNNQNNNGVYWNWFNDLNYGQSALSKHLLTNNENLLVTYDLLPLKISVDTTTPTVGTTNTIILELFGFDQTFSPIWNPATSSTLSINGVASTNDTGKYYLVTTSTNPIVLSGSKTGFSTTTITLYPTTAPASTSTSGGGGGGSTPPTNQTISDSVINSVVNKLISFIKSNQSSDGKIVDGGISDWFTLSFASKNIYAADVKNASSSLHDYVYNTDASSLDSELNSCAAYPRHILSLRASGVANTDTKISALKTKLDGCVQNNNFGQSGINDDVFGLIAAIAVGENQDSSVVQTTLSAIKSNQQPDGGFAYPGPFESPDLTGAAINALKYAQNNGNTVDANIFTKAKQYLKNQQLADGGWGYITSDALTTSWAVMGINSLGEGQNEWFNSAGKNPWYILTTLTNDHFAQSWDGNVDWFGTKSAIPALLGKSWPIILDPQTTNISGGSGSSPATPTSTVTTTIATTTIATTTVTTTTAVTTTTIVTSTPSTTVELTEEKPQIKPVILTVKSPVKAAEVSPAPITPSSSQPQEQLTSAEKIPDQTNPIDSLPLDTPTRRTAKKVLAVTGGSAAALGLYLGLRLFKNVL
ncbi:MAG: hypothetical protein NT034_00015 [Candidatus Magasanikbacteria bacterium]|nr:hypothetical protein [Candidatus Magasanikbacteria bacterium]